MGFRGIQSTNIISTDVGLTDPLLILNKSGTTAVELSPNTVNDVNALDSSIVKGNLSAGDITADEITINTTFVHPKGTAAQRPASPVAGQTWFNTDTSLFEGYDGTGWIQFIPSTYVYIP